jgi:TRAP-type mannitol/chloroaromatic compound transport system substrate-binding protein
MTKEKQPVSRRKFLRGAGLAAGAGAATLAMPAVVTAQSPVVIKMQSSWPAGNIFHDMAEQYVERVNAMAGSRLHIDLLPAGAVVQAFQIQDAVNDGVLDGGHHVCAYWYGKTRPRRCSVRVRSTVSTAPSSSPGSTTAAARNSTTNSSRRSSD